LEHERQLKLVELCALGRARSAEYIWRRAELAEPESKYNKDYRTTTWERVHDPKVRPGRGYLGPPIAAPAEDQKRAPRGLRPLGFFFLPVNPGLLVPKPAS
jgi:hypothetical protein